MKKIAYFGLFILASVLLACYIRSPKILIIGDSISIGYTPYVEEFFSGKAIVSHNPGNAQHTGTGQKNIEEWVGNEMWDIRASNTEDKFEAVYINLAGIKFRKIGLETELKYGSKHESNRNQ